MNDCLFCKIANKELDTTLIYEDEALVGFEDISPQAPNHSLIIPKTHITTLNDLDESHKQLAGNMILAATKIAKQKSMDQAGYRLIMNCNQDGGQTVYHIHLHIIGGRKLSWPPG